MLVKELIEKLKLQNQDAQIVITDKNGYFNDYISENVFTDDGLIGRPIVPIFCGPHEFFVEHKNENSNINKPN